MSKAETRRMASLKALFALFFYLIIPLLAIYIIINSYPELGKERFENMIYWFIPLSILLVIVSQLSIRYDKGDFRRFIFNIGYVVITLMWLVAFLGGGIVITESWGDYQFSLHLWKYILLIIAVAAFNIFYYVMEWRVYRKDVNTDNRMDRNSSIGLTPFLSDD